MSGLNRRALMTAGKQPLVIEEKPIHAAPPRGLVVKVHYSGICHSDIHIWENEHKIDENTTVPIFAEETLPLLLGHEISGEIYSIGSDVTDSALKVGDKVMVYAWAGCKDCGVCKGGRQNICLQGGMYNYGCGPGTEGGYQQYVSVAFASDVVKVPENIPMDMAALMSCSGLTAFNAVSTARPVLEEFIKYDGKAALLVIGAGGLGQWALQIAKAVFPEGLTIVSADISEEKVALGKKAGADKTMVWPISASIPEIVEASQAVVPGGFHAVLDFVNNPTTIGRPLHVMTRGAVSVQVGLFGGFGNTISLGFLPLQNISIMGVFTGSYKQQLELVEVVSSHKVEPPPIFRVKLEEAYDYLLKLRDGKVPGRAVIDFINN